MSHLNASIRSLYIQKLIKIVDRNIAAKNNPEPMKHSKKLLKLKDLN